MALAVTVKGINGFGKELWTTDAFWWDASRVEEYLAGRLQPDEPWPAWSTRISPTDMQHLMSMFPVRYDQQQHHWVALSEQMKGSVEFKITVFEWSSE